MTKAELRKQYLAKRKNLSESDVQQASRLLCELFFVSVDLSFTKVVHCYLPIAKKSEPDTWMIVDRMRREFPHVRIALPRIKNDGEMESIYFEGLHQLRQNKWDIPEPAQGVPVDPQKIDVVLVPLLAFDRSGHRVGYGKGFYDRFLRTCRPDCKKVGLAFFEPEDQVDDSSGFDVRLDLCITPVRVFNF